MQNKSYIAIAAGRSGGHLIPGITLAHNYCLQNPGTSLIIFSTTHTLDKKIITQYALDTFCIPIALDNIPTRWYQYPLFCLQFTNSFFKSMYFLIKFRPTSVILMGGYISIPVCAAAFILRIKCDLYELNAVPGKATKVLTPWASKIHVCFNQAKKFFPAQKTVLSPYPLRFTQPLFPTHKAKELLNISKTKTVILILGGSQGSVSLNKIIANYIKEYVPNNSNITVIHQTGHQDFTNWKEFYSHRSISALVFDYNHDLSLYYQAADIIIARAGAGTIFEALFYQKKTILIPLEIPGNDHQLHNAQALCNEYPELFSIIRQQELMATCKPLAEKIGFNIN